jgi:hypothetical protein
LFEKLKLKYLGQEVYSRAVATAAASGYARVYVWEKQGAYSLNIVSTRFSYVQAGYRNDATVTFDEPDIERFMNALNDARSFLANIVRKGL